MPGGIGERIQQQRKVRGLTQEQLAAAASMSVMSIRRYESGDRTPKAEQLEKIAEVLCVPADYLRYGNFSLSQNVAARLLDGYEVANIGSRIADTIALNSSSHPESVSSPAARIERALQSLNDAGQNAAADRIDELTMIPKYQQKPHEAAGTVLARSKDKDT